MVFWVDFKKGKDFKKSQLFRFEPVLLTNKIKTEAKTGLKRLFSLRILQVPVNSEAKVPFRSQIRNFFSYK
jgi:hypothetical protein